MASLSDYIEGKIMNAIFNNASPAAIQLSDRFVKLYIGDPGEAGTANPAVETTRKSLTSAAAVDGVFTNTNALVWTNVAGSEDYTFVGVWDDVAAGNFLWGGVMTANPVTAGDTFTIAIGGLVATLS